MDGRSFDTLSRAVSDASSRRGALRLMAGAALAAALAKVELTSAKKGKGKNKKKCRKLNQGCGGKKKKCCRGLVCTDGTCLTPSEPECVDNNDCVANEICEDGICVPEPPECDQNSDCGSNEVCDDGVCVPEPPECDSNSDCGDNQICDSGNCICPAIIEDRCVIECVGSGDCPGGCDCRNLFPDNGGRVCVDDSALCNANSCDNSDDCFGDEICAEADCGGSAFVGRCRPVCVLGED